MARSNRTSKKQNTKVKREKKKISPLKKLDRTQKIILAAIIAVLILLTATYGIKIVKLKAEQRELKQQQEQLEAEQSKKTKELKNSTSEDYVKEQARKKLRLLDKDEILFQFEEDK